MDDDALTTLKILMIGESNVGKSSVLLRFTEDTFDDSLKNTIGVDYQKRTITVDENKVTLSIWDTAGQERFKTLTAKYYRDGQGAILVYDVTDKSTLVKLEHWLNELNVYCNKSNVVKMVIGNKTDMPNRQVSVEEGREFARKHKMLFIETSAKTAHNIECCFEELVQKILQTPDLWETYPKLANYSSNTGPRRRINPSGIQLVDADSGDVNPQSACSC